MLPPCMSSVNLVEKDVRVNIPPDHSEVQITAVTKGYVAVGMSFSFTTMKHLLTCVCWLTCRVGSQKGLINV